MFSRKRTKAIILNKKEQGEFDKSLLFYTEKFGKIQLLGKGIRKETSKLRFHLESLSLLEIEFIEGRIKKILTDVRVLDSYLSINNNLKKMALSYKVTEDLEQLIKGEERDIQIWDLVEKTFVKINNSDKEFITYQYFFWNLLFILGYGPNLYSCIQCQKKINPNKLILSPEEGGLICSLCSSQKTSFSVEKEVIKIIRICLSDLATLNRIKISWAVENSLWQVSQKYLSLIK